MGDPGSISLFFNIKLLLSLELRSKNKGTYSIQMFCMKYVFLLSSLKIFFNELKKKNPPVFSEPHKNKTHLGNRSFPKLLLTLISPQSWQNSENFPRGLTYPLKINGWKMKFPVEMVSFCGDMLILDRGNTWSPRRPGPPRSRAVPSGARGKTWHG